MSKKNTHKTVNNNFKASKKHQVILKKTEKTQLQTLLVMSYVQELKQNLPKTHPT